MGKKFFKSLVITNFIKSLTLSLTGMIDCAVVGHYLGADGLSAMKLAMPVFSILSLFSFVLSTGLSVTVSKEIAANSKARANDIFRSVCTVICVVGLCITVIGILYPSVLTDFFTGSSCDPAIKAQTAAYLQPILIGALPILLYDVLGTIALLGGAAKYLKLSSAAIFLIDIAADLLAVVFHAGMRGIAFASALAYLAALIMILLYFLNKRSLFKLGLRLPERLVLRNVFLLGLPAGITILCQIILPMAINRLILSYGTIAGLAALSIQDSVRYVPCSLCTGIANATLILTGLFAAEINLPALREEKRIIVRWSFIGGTAAAVLLMILSSPLIWIFTDDQAVHSLGVSSLLFYLPGVPFIAINSSVISFCQALGKKWLAAFLAVLNHLIVPLIFAWVLIKPFGDLGLYASFSVSEIVTGIVFFAFLLIRKHTKQSLLQEMVSAGDIRDELSINITNQDEAIAASRQVNELCLKNNFSPKQAFHVALTTEELAINSITHGFNDNKPHLLELRAVITGDQMILRLRDDGRPFDLTERFKMIEPDDPTRNIGLRIIFASADDVSYNSSMNMNNVCIKINSEISSLRRTAGPF